MSSVNFVLIDTLRRRGEPARAMALASGAGGMRIVSGIFSVSHRTVGQVIFARRLTRTCAVSGKSPSNKSTAGSSTLWLDQHLGLLALGQFALLKMAAELSDCHRD